MAEISSEVIAASAGALAGSLGGGLAYWWRRRRERIQTINVCVFSLLDVWHRLHMLSTSDIKRSLHILERKALERGADSQQIEHLMDSIRPQLQRAFKDALNGMVGVRLEQIREDYSRAVSILSKEEPVLAYRINGHQDFHERLALLSQYCDTFAGDNSDKMLQAELTERLLTNNLLDTLRAELENDLQAVARKAGLKIRYTVYKIVRNLRSRVEREINERIDKLAEEYFADQKLG